MYIYPVASFQRPAMTRPNNLARQSFQGEKQGKRLEGKELIKAFEQVKLNSGQEITKADRDFFKEVAGTTSDTNGLKIYIKFKRVPDTKENRKVIEIARDNIDPVFKSFSDDYDEILKNWPKR